MNLDGGALRHIGGPGSGNDQFSDPSDICAYSGLDIFIADSGNDRIVRLDRNLNYLAQFHTLDRTQSDLTFERPQSVLLGRRGDLFIADGSNDRILKIDPSGQPIFSFGYYGGGVGPISEPKRIEPAPDGSLHVLDICGRVTHFDEYGGYLSATTAVLAGSPTGLAISESAIWVCSDSLLWIYDHYQRQTAVFTPEELKIEASVTFVDIAIRRENIWLLDSDGSIHHYQFSIVK
ncbi:hypothetical protein CEE37_06080 [candidate division LCP-89 bacterium B3_LCP]|uniref:Uncharacterized protein n=1 Tax=candidate division LCP-89 bacterium B3_LCP TaxID=2012998 RepID=A0A532V1Z2_UNCL8|nr:MAG: hypothetical protein CEE37_06080 [candidate division LCP-89 bacterium B3_LCP]